jgi:leader peptidase (prepilin peptidase) / N-methyltransferase
MMLLGTPRLFRRLRQRPLAELAAVAAIAVALGAISILLVPGAAGAFGALLAIFMVLIAAVDARYFIIPDALTVCALTAGLAHAALSTGSGVGTSLFLPAARGAAFALTLLCVRILYRWFRGREGLGLGDVKLAFVAGVWLEVPTMPLALECAALSALAACLGGQFGGNKGQGLTMRLPFGLFLAPSIWLSWLLQETVLRPTVSLF